MFYLTEYIPCIHTSPCNHCKINANFTSFVLSFLNMACALLFFFKIYLFVFWLWWAFVAVCRLSLVAAGGGCFSLQWILYCGVLALGTGFSSWQHMRSVVRLMGLLLCGMWDLSGPGTELMSLALQGRFLTTRPLGKHCTCSYSTS